MKPALINIEHVHIHAAEPQKLHVGILHSLGALKESVNVEVNSWN